MISILDSNKIDQYINGLKSGFEDAERENDQKNAKTNALVKDYARKVDKFTIVTDSWHKIKHTEELGKNITANILNLEKSLGELISFAKLSNRAIRAFLVDIIELTQLIEHQHACCIEALNKKINNLSDIGLDNEGGIVLALKQLSLAYSEAFNQALITLQAVLDTSKNAYRLRYAIINGDEPKIQLCGPVPGLGATDNTEETEHQEGLQESIEELKIEFAKLFPMNQDSYYCNVHNAFYTVEKSKNDTFEKLTLAKQKSDISKNKMYAFKKSLEAAIMAKSC